MRHRLAALSARRFTCDVALSAALSILAACKDQPAPPAATGSAPPPAVALAETEAAAAAPSAPTGADKDYQRLRARGEEIVKSLEKEGAAEQYPEGLSDLKTRLARVPSVLPESPEAATAAMTELKEALDAGLDHEKKLAMVKSDKALRAVEKSLNDLAKLGAAKSHPAEFGAASKKFEEALKFHYQGMYSKAMAEGNDAGSMARALLDAVAGSKKVS